MNTTLTIAHYATQWAVSESTAARRLRAMVAAGQMTRRAFTEMRYSRTHGYTQRLRPVQVVEFFPVEAPAAPATFGDSMTAWAAAFRAPAVEAPQDQGITAAMDGKSLEDNPHPAGSIAAQAWEDAMVGSWQEQQVQHDAGFMPPLSAATQAALEQAMHKANEAGYNAAYAGRGTYDNPHAEDSTLARAWEAGWQQAKDTIREMNI